MSKAKVDEISKVMKRKSGRTNTVRIQDLEKDVDYLKLVVEREMKFITEVLKRSDNLEDLLIKLYDSKTLKENEDE